MYHLPHVFQHFLTLIWRLRVVICGRHETYQKSLQLSNIRTWGLLPWLTVITFAFELIAKIWTSMAISWLLKNKHCAPAPNGLFHRNAPRPDPRCWGVLFDRVVVLSSSWRHTRTHNLSIGLPLLHQKSLPEGSFWSSIADRTLVSDFIAISQ